MRGQEGFIPNMHIRHKGIQTEIEAKGATIQRSICQNVNK